MIREVEFSQTGTFQGQPVCVGVCRCVELTLSRRWATCPLLLDSMKVARHTRATYGVLGGAGGDQPSAPYGNLRPGWDRWEVFGVF